MRMDLDTEDRVDRAHAALDCIIELVGLTTVDRHNRITPGPMVQLLTIVREEYGRALLPASRPPRAFNDVED